MTTSAQSASSARLDVDDLRGKVQRMYEEVARKPKDGRFHFEIGRELAERLGYPPIDLDRIPSSASDSFAGVGYYFDLAALQHGERVVDLGSGSGMDTFIAAQHVGSTGSVIGVDMTDAQREKAEALAHADRFTQVRFQAGLIEDLPVGDGEADCVISNGVINLCPDKTKVFADAARVLRSGGRLAIADIVTDVQLPENVVCNSTLWAACIGGAAQQDSYRAAIESAGFRILVVRNNNAYGFLSTSAQNASRQYGVKSVSLLAIKDAR